MIKTHPTELMLRAFAADELPLPLAVGVSAHCELCPDCAARLKGCEEELARQYLEVLGGQDNLVTIDACITRLRLTLKDRSIVDERKHKAGYGHRAVG